MKNRILLSLVFAAFCGNSLLANKPDLPVGLGKEPQGTERKTTRKPKKKIGDNLENTQVGNEDQGEKLSIGQRFSAKCSKMWGSTKEFCGKHKTSATEFCSAHKLPLAVGAAVIVTGVGFWVLAKNSQAFRDLVGINNDDEDKNWDTI